MLTLRGAESVTSKYVTGARSPLYSARRWSPGRGLPSARLPMMSAATCACVPSRVGSIPSAHATSGAMSGTGTAAVCSTSPRDTPRR